MKPLFRSILFVILASAIPVKAEYNTGEFIDGLQYMQAVIDAGPSASSKVPKPADGDRVGPRALDYLAGYWGAYRGIIEEDSFSSDKKILGGASIEVAKMPKEMFEVMKDVLRFYRLFPYFRETPTANFLHAFFMSQYAPDGHRDRAIHALSGMVVSATLKYVEDPTKLPSFDAWVRRCEGTVKERGLEALDPMDRMHFKLFRSSQDLGINWDARTAAPAKKEPSPKDMAATAFDRTMEVKVGGSTLKVKAPRGFDRLSGRLKSLDDAVDGVAAGAKNEILILFGTIADSADVAQGKFPLMERNITLQRATALPPLVRPDQFLELKKGLRDQYKPGSKLDVTELYESVSKASTEAVQKLTDSSASLRAGQPMLLGIFHDDENSMSHTMITRVRVVVGGLPQDLNQVTSIGMLYIGSKIITIHANARLRQGEDIQWTQDVVTEVRNSILKDN